MNDITIINAIEKLANRKNVAGQSPYLKRWQHFYAGNYNELDYWVTSGTGDKLNLKKKTLNFPKKICEDFANFCLNEKTELVVGGDVSQKALDLLLDREDFWSRANSNYEQAMGLSIGAWVEGIEGLTINDKGEMIGKGKLNIRFVNATKVFPITIKDGKIIECAFATENTNETSVEMHLLEEGKYVVKIFNLDKQTLTQQNEALIFNTQSDVPLFQLVYPNLTNNLDVDSHLPISVYANQLDKFIALDEKYDDFDIEFKNGKRRIFVNSELWKVDAESGEVVKTFDKNETLFHVLNFQDNTKPLIESSAEALREQSYINAINTELNLISMGVGLGTDLYNFSGAAGRPLQTATAVLAKNSEAIRTVKKHEKVVRQALIDFVKAVRYLSNTFTDEPIGQFEDSSINVIFDDTFFEDKDSEQTRDRNNLIAGLMSVVEYRMRWFGEDEKQAKKYVYENLRFKLINDNLQGLTSGAMPTNVFVDICYGDKNEQEKQDIISAIEENKARNTVTDFNAFENETM